MGKDGLNETIMEAAILPRVLDAVRDLRADAGG
jgi:hypothetical protein